jgi:ubiquinone/menaquinone biosynthesis C-methylase UbiE
VEPQKKILLVGCGTGNLLAVVEPSKGKGIDICSEIIEIARRRNPSFEFAVAFPDKEEFQLALKPDEQFDYILFNAQAALPQVKAASDHERRSLSREGK